MRHFDLTPLYRSTIGFDRLGSLLDTLGAFEGDTPSYPPYNIERVGENEYLFNIDEDPRERANLAAARPEELRRLRHAFERWNETMLSDKGVEGYLFGPDLLARLASSAYLVRSDSNRVGLRLEGPELIRSGEHRGELASEGIVLGAVQIPPDGRPVVFLRDHPVTGGYPVVAVVDETDLDRCAQLRPGARIRFTSA